jgi:Helix-turn-helix domain
MTEVSDIALLTEFQAAEALAVERATLANWRRRGLGPKYLRLPSLGHGAVRYRRTDLENFIAVAIAGGEALDSPGVGASPTARDSR